MTDQTPGREGLSAEERADLSAVVRDYLVNETDVTRPNFHATALVHRLGPALDAARAEERARAEAERIEKLRAWDEIAALAAAVERVWAIHEPIRVYDECVHDDCENGRIEIYDYIACKDSQIGWGCPTCCYDDEYPREDCPHGGDHHGVTLDQACPTIAALDAPAPSHNATESGRDLPSNAPTPEQPAGEVVHQVPTDGKGLMPCCGRTPFEVDRDERMTIVAEQVTCPACAKGGEDRG